MTLIETLSHSIGLLYGTMNKAMKRKKLAFFFKVIKEPESTGP